MEPGKSSVLNLPNQITISRLIVAALLFVFLSLEIAGWGVVGPRHRALNIALIVFVICVATDWLDGYLARRTNQVTVFGRIADPFVDKVVVCGTFIYMVKLTPLIKPWFPVVLVAREFLVSGLRGYIESRGIPFGARSGGKIKMVLQSVTIPVVLFYQANLAGQEQETALSTAFLQTARVLILLTLLATILSAWDYIRLSVKALRDEKASSDRSADSPPDP